MPIDVHAHYVPAQLLEAVRQRGAAIGVSLREAGGAAAIAFDYGFATRPMFARLTQPAAERRAWLEEQGLDRQLIATWPDMYGGGLAEQPAAAWHRMLNETMAEWCADQVDRFSWVCSAPLPHADAAAATLDWAAAHGAVGVMLPANVEGVNIGELPLEPMWARAAALGLPVLLHPVLVGPAPRAARFALAQVVQYPFDTTLGVGSMLATGVLERHPGLRVMVSHGGGALPWLAGRFDVMHARIDRAAQGVTAEHAPSAYLRRLWFDTIVHQPAALRFLREVAGLETLVLGSDYSFPPADLTPIASLRAAGFDAAEMRAVTDENPRRLFPRLTQ